MDKKNNLKIGNYVQLKTNRFVSSVGKYVLLTNIVNMPNGGTVPICKYLENEWRGTKHRIRWELIKRKATYKEVVASKI